MKTWRILFYLAVFATAHAQNGFNLSYDNGTFQPTSLPACNLSSSTYTQAAVYTWKLQCYDANGNPYKLISTGQINGSGNGACNSLGMACSAGGSRAPNFAPQQSMTSTNFLMWMNIWSVGLTGNGSCGTPNMYPLPNPAATTPLPNGCVCNPTNPNCKNSSPIVIDVSGEGFFLTDLAHGVQFRKGPNSPLEQFSWTDPTRHNAWLVRPNADGSVTSMSMNMFGNLSPQPTSSQPNGYSALAYWAQQAGCGKLSWLDFTSCAAVWQQLKLWHDANQDGVAQPGELQTLEAAGVSRISLEYHESRYIDQFGNQFFFEAKVKDAAGHEADRCYDVFLLH